MARPRSEQSSRSMLTTLAFVLLLSACGGDGPTGVGNDGGNNGGNNGGDTTPTVKDDPSFQSDIFPIFTSASCTASGCHGSGQGGLTMTSSSVAYGNLVNVASPTSGEIRVIPGNSGDSYLVKKLEGTAAFGVRMPFGGAPLSSTDLQNIKNWIDQGAKNN